MKRWQTAAITGLWLGLVFLESSSILSAQTAPAGWPVLASGETLDYNLIWPSGISLGEGSLKASHSGKRIFLEAAVDADLPQYHAVYNFSSETDEQLCSIRFHQRLREGKSTTDDSFEFDQEHHKVRRTVGGHSTESEIPGCARDPLALLYYFRQQLAVGKLPVGTPESKGTFYLGGNFSAQYDAVTPEKVKLGSKEWDGDRFLIRVAGPNGNQSLEVWIRPDASRTPVAVRVVFPLATFSAELH
jgi:uncharacterized protein DUF3108